MRHFWRHRRAALLAVVAVTAALSGCASVDEAAPPPPDASGESSPSIPTSSPTPMETALAQVFDGDCETMVSESGAESFPGPPLELDSATGAWLSLFEGGSVEAAGGVVCDWLTDAESMRVLVLPDAVIPDAARIEDSSCTGEFGCSWSTVGGQWWVSVTTGPGSDAAAWVPDPASTEAVARLVAAATPRWEPPAVLPAVDPLDCEGLLSAVAAAVPGFDMFPAGWGTGILAWTVQKAGLLDGCPWAQTDGGSLSVRVQAMVGEPSPDDLAALGAESLELPSGTVAHLVREPFSDRGSLLATVGDRRVSISGTTPVAEPARAVQILDALLAAPG